MSNMTNPAEQLPPWPRQEIESGEWAGWTQYIGDPFELHAGPFYHRRLEDGRIVCAMRTEAIHLNGGGFMHGGAMMTFADFALFAIAQTALADRHAVTATFNAEFVGAVKPGSLIECTGEVVRNARSMVFVRGLMKTGDEPVMTFSATLKKLGSIHG